MSEIAYTKITRLSVKNYRSLADIDIALSPQTVFVGKNGTGKSSVIDVLRFVRDVVTDGFDLALLNRGGLDEVRCWYAEEGEEISIQLTFDGPEWSGEYGFAFGTCDENDYAIKWEKLSLSGARQEDDTACVSTLLLEAADGKLVRYPKRIGLISLDHPYDPAHALHRYKTTLFLAQLAPISLRIEAVRHFLATMNFYDISPDNLRTPQKMGTPFPLREDGANLATTLRELKRAQRASMIQNGLNYAVNGLEDYSIESVNGFLVTKLHYVTRNGRVKEVRSNLRGEADGTIRLLAILTALNQNRSLSPLAIEEPEKAMSYRALGWLYEVLEEAAISYQVMITTHSATLIDKFPVDSFLVVEKEDGVTKIGPLCESQRSSIEEELFSAGEIMQMEGLQREHEIEETQLCLPLSV